MQPWFYNHTPIESIEDIPEFEDKIGFIYKITNKLTGKIYIGRKNLKHKRKTKISAKEKKATATRKRFKQVVKESDWKEYWGSCKELLEDIKTLGEEHFSREILEFSCNQKNLSYLEVKYQFRYNVLEEHSYNGNILAKFFTKDAIGC